MSLPGEVSLTRRVTVVAALAVTLLGGAVADRFLRPAEAAPARAALVPAGMPQATPVAALSSTWYCAGGTATPGGAADAHVTIANPSDRAMRGTLRVHPSDGQPRTAPIAVGPHDRADLRIGDVVAAPYAAATIELDGGGAVVEHVVVGPNGFSAAPCASAPSEQWYLANGSTGRDDELVVFLFNPFPEDAIASVTFDTEEGRRAPQNLQGLVVRSGGLVVVKPGDHFRYSSVATAVAARRGRLVVDRLQLRGGARRGISLALGAPSTGAVWYFPEGTAAPGTEEHIHIFNPNDREADVDVELTLQDDEAEPFTLKVPAGQHTTLALGSEDRVPKGPGFSVTVRSMNDVPVVAERTIAAAAPGGYNGVTDTLGSRVLARAWALAVGGTGPTLSESVVVLNAGEADAVVDVVALQGGREVRLPGLTGRPVPAGGRAVFPMADHVLAPSLSLVVRSSTPVAVERVLHVPSVTSLSATVGIPLWPAA